METVNNHAKEQLKSYVERIERLEEEKAALSGDIKELFDQAKSQGFDTKVLRALIRLRKQDPDDRSQYEAVLVTYMHALGMQSDLFDMDRFAALPRNDTAPINGANGLLAAE